jgi:hypothetical protein
VGRVLYNDLRTSTAPSFRQADVLAKSFQSDNPDLESKFDFVHSANVIHLFSPNQQLHFLRALVFLAKPGGLLWGRQVGLREDENMQRYRQPDGKGARFTAQEFESLIEQATGWDKSSFDYEGRLLRYHELRNPRPDKDWVLQWRVRVPVTKQVIPRVVEVH